MRGRVVVLRTLGVLFLLGAVLKSLDLTAFAVQISYYGIVREPRIVWAIAVGVIAVESALGMAALLGIAVRRVTLPAIGALLVWFTALLAWAWAFRDIENCGCFGKFLPMTPPEAILKNIVMLAMAAYAFGWGRGKRAVAKAPSPQEPVVVQASSLQEPSAPKDARPQPTATIGIWKPALLYVVTLAVTTFALAYGGKGENGLPLTRSDGSSSAPLAKYTLEWEGKTISLAEGTYIVAMISDSCEHCGEIVAALNQLAETPGFPPVVGLVLGEGDTLKQFRETYKPRFATALIPVLEFFNLIGDHPPRFYVVEDGKPRRQWDTEQAPPASAFVEALGKTQ